MSQVRNVLEARFPGLHAEIERLLIEAEAQYDARSGQAPSEFLLEHTRRTAAIAYKIATMEQIDPFLPVLVALYHDAGKFYAGGYHEDAIPEEEHSALLAEQMLAAHQVPRSIIDPVLAALRALYDERLPCVGACRVVQDADRLDKLGALGVGAFFTKAALRGRGMIEALSQTLTRELTYANASPRSMFTATGRQLAAEQAPKTVAFFDQLLEQLESWGISSFERHVVLLDEEFRTRDGAMARGVEVTVAMPRFCPDCQGELGLTHRREQGVKCQRFIAYFTCSQCNYSGGTSLCLPVLA